MNGNINNNRIGGYNGNACQTCYGLKVDAGSTDAVFATAKWAENSGKRLCSCQDNYGILQRALADREVELINRINQIGYDGEEQCQRMLRQIESWNLPNFKIGFRIRDVAPILPSPAPNCKN